MPPLNPEQAVNTQLWALLEADEPFTSAVVLNNRVKADTADWPILDEKKLAADTGDQFPRVRVEAGETTGMEAVLKTFRTPADRVDFGVPITVNHDIAIIHRTLVLADQLALENTIRRCFLAAGPTLGIMRPGNRRSWVSSVVLRNPVRRTEKTVATGRHMRTISRMRLQVNGRPFNSELVGD